MKTGFVKIVRGKEDPWANYRHGRVEDICPDYKRPVVTRRSRLSAVRRRVPSLGAIVGWGVRLLSRSHREKVVCVSPPAYVGRKGVVRRTCHVP
jgi:hypothetical protein